MDERTLKPKQVADLLQLSSRQVANLVERGLPKHGHGSRAYYLWSEVLPFYIAFKEKIAKGSVRPDSGEEPSLTEAQARKYDLEAQRAAIKLARERGEVVSIADVEKALSQCFGNVRSRLLSIPGKLAPRIAGCRSKPQIKALIENEIHEALSELAVRAGDVVVVGEDVPDES
jgi:phage terminase Nu1 subunit (DNA packaging protein)